jgi:hypothetical protein
MVVDEFRVASEQFDDGNPPMDAVFLAGMKPSRRGRPKLDAPFLEKNERMASQGKTLSQVLVPAQPQDLSGSLRDQI